MVVDLTNSSRYYSADADGTSEFQYSGPDLPTVYHRKVLVGLREEMHFCVLLHLASLEQ